MEGDIQSTDNSHQELEALSRDNRLTYFEHAIAGRSLADPNNSSRSLLTEDILQIHEHQLFQLVDIPEGIVSEHIQNIRQQREGKSITAYFPIFIPKKDLVVNGYILRYMLPVIDDEGCMPPAIQLQVMRHDYKENRFIPITDTEIVKKFELLGNYRKFLDLDTETAQKEGIIKLTYRLKGTS